MTEQERLEGFKQILMQAEQQFGVTIAAYYQERLYQDGQRVPTAGYDFALIAGWQPPEQDKNTK